MTLSCFVSGILIDIDHVYDFIKEFGFPFKVNNFVQAVYKDEIPKLTFIFHSWELVCLMGIIAWFTHWNPWITGIVIGFAHHMVLDKLNNGERLRTYLFFWRWKRQFEFNATFPNTAKKKMQNNVPEVK